MVVVEVSVGDTNDNAPVFPSSPLIIGVPSYVAHNDLITRIKVRLLNNYYKLIRIVLNILATLTLLYALTLQGEDADTGNNSVLVYNLVGGADKDSFYLNPITGEIHSKIDMSVFPKKVLEIEVLATDNWGNGNSVATEAKVIF